MYKQKTKIKVNLKHTTSKQLKVNYKRGSSTKDKNQPLSMEKETTNLQ